MFALLNRLEPLTYLLLRSALGAILLTHGLPKLLGRGHGSMADPMASSVRLIETVMDLPFAPQLAFLVMVLETAGAVLLLLGIGTRLVAALFSVEMLGICSALWPTWAWIDRGIEYPVLLGVLAIYIVARGAGRYSVDAWWGTRGASSGASKQMV